MRENQGNVGSREEVEERLGARLEEVRGEIGELNERVVRFILARPAACILGALAFGFIVGRVVSRR